MLGERSLVLAKWHLLAKSLLTIYVLLLSERHLLPKWYLVAEGSLLTEKLLLPESHLLYSNAWTGSIACVLTPSSPCRWRS